LSTTKEKTMSMTPSRAFVALTLVAGSGVASADPTAIFPLVDACVEAALQQQPGHVIGWRIDPGHEPTPIQVDVVASDDKVWTLKCADAKVSGSERKTGNKNYKLLSTRAKVPEVSARFTAVNSYPIAEVKKMDYALSWRGRPYYTYEMSLNDGREATVDVNAETGQIDRSKSERK